MIFRKKIFQKSKKIFLEFLVHLQKFFWFIYELYFLALMILRKKIFFQKSKKIFKFFSSTPEINFLSFLVESDQYLPNMLSFLHRCLILMPKTMSDSLPLFDEIFIEFWENAKMKKWLNF